MSGKLRDVEPRQVFLNLRKKGAVSYRTGAQEAKNERRGEDAYQQNVLPMGIRVFWNPNVPLGDEKGSTWIGEKRGKFFFL